jgi:autotransporter-associated beta strand protein
LADAELSVPANIKWVSGSAGFTKLGFGTLRLAGNNNFNGEIVIDEGRVIAASSLAFGDVVTGTIVNSNASLVLENGVMVSGGEILRLNSDARPALEVPSGSASWGGLVSLDRTAEVRVGDAAAILVLNATIIGAGGLIKSGEGRLDLSGASANSYGGLTVVQQGQVHLLKPANRLTVPRDVIIGDDVGAPPTTLLRATAPGQLWTNATVTIRRSGLFDSALPALSDTTLRAFPGSGRLNLSANTALSINNDVAFEFSGVLTSTDARLHKNGGAMMHLSGDSSGFTGLLSINAGTVKVDGNLANVAVRVLGASILRGDGTLGDTVIMDADGVVIVDSKTPGRLGGDLELGALGGLGGIVGLDFFGPSATGGNEQIISRGDVNLNNKRLSASFFYPPHEGDVLTVIRKDSAGAITGTFSGWPEGTTAQIGDVTVRASYVGGDGNDFTLTVTNLPLGSGGLQVVNGNGGSAFVPNDCLLLWLPVTTAARAQSRDCAATCAALRRAWWSRFLNPPSLTSRRTHGARTFRRSKSALSRRSPAAAQSNWN